MPPGGFRAPADLAGALGPRCHAMSRPDSRGPPSDPGTASGTIDPPLGRRNPQSGPVRGEKKPPAPSSDQGSPGRDRQGMVGWEVGSSAPGWIRLGDPAASGGVLGEIGPTLEWPPGAGRPALPDPIPGPPMPPSGPAEHCSELKPPAPEPPPRTTNRPSPYKRSPRALGGPWSGCYPPGLVKGSCPERTWLEPAARPPERHKPRPKVPRNDPPLRMTGAA